jgi:hypothetical protein
VATQQQARAIQIAASSSYTSSGAPSLPGYQDNDYRSAQDGGFIIQVPSAVVSTEQQGQFNYIYFMMRGYTSQTITTSQANAYKVARTIFDTSVSQRKLRTQWHTGHTYRNATRFLDSNQYPPNDGVGTYQFAIYVATTDSQGIFMAQYPQCYKCTYTQTGYNVTSAGNITLTFSDVIPTPYDLSLGAVARDIPRSQGSYTRQVRVTSGNQQHIIYASTTNTAQTTNLSNYAARTFGTSLDRALSQTSSNTGVVTDIPYGAGDSYYLYSRLYSGDPANANGVYGQGSGSRIWDRVYYRSSSIYNAWQVYGTDDQVTLNPTSFQISEAQSQSTSTQLQTTVSGNTGQHTFRFSLNTSGAIGSSGGITAVSASSAQINLSNGNSLFPGAGQSDQFYLWVKNGADGQAAYMPTNTLRSVTVSTQAAQDTIPDAPVLNPTAYAGASTNTYYTAGWTTQGVSSGVQVPWQGVNAQLSTDGSSWSSSIQRAQGQTAYIRVLSSSSSSTTVTGTVRFAQQTSIATNLSVVTSSGGGASQGGGSGNYGLAVYNSTGQSVIIDESSRIGNLLNTTTLSFQSGQTGVNSSGRHAFSGVNCQDDNKIAVIYRSDIFSQFQPVCQITRRSAAQQYGVTVKVPFEIPAQQSPQSVDLWLLRF